MHLPVPYTPRLLYLASQGEPLPLDAEHTVWVQMLLRSGHIRAETVPKEQATKLMCRLTPKGEEFLKWFET